MIYPTNLLRAFAVVCSWRILEATNVAKYSVYKEKSSYLN